MNCGILTKRKWIYRHMSVLPRVFVICSLTFVEVGRTFFLSEFYLILFYFTLFYFFYFILFKFVFSYHILCWFILFVFLLFLFIFFSYYSIQFNCWVWHSSARLSIICQACLLPEGDRLQRWHSCLYTYSIPDWVVGTVYIVCTHVLYADCDCTVVV